MGRVFFYVGHVPRGVVYFIFIMDPKPRQKLEPLDYPTPLLRG